MIIIFATGFRPATESLRKSSTISKASSNGKMKAPQDMMHNGCVKFVSL